MVAVVDKTSVKYSEDAWKAHSIYLRYKLSIVCDGCGHIGVNRLRNNGNHYYINCHCKEKSKAPYSALNCTCSKKLPLHHLISLADANGWIYNTAPPPEWQLEFDEDELNGMYYI